MNKIFSETYQSNFDVDEPALDARMKKEGKFVTK
jgi:hypothetical protein